MSVTSSFPTSPFPPPTPARLAAEIRLHELEAELRRLRGEEPH